MSPELLLFRRISAVVLRILKVPHYPLTWAASSCGALIGTFSRIGFDAIMHADMNPWWPLAAGNGLLFSLDVDRLHALCFALGIAGFVVVALRARKHGRA